MNVLEVHSRRRRRRSNNSRVVDVAGRPIDSAGRPAPQIPRPRVSVQMRRNNRVRVPISRALRSAPIRQALARQPIPMDGTISLSKGVRTVAAPPIKSGSLCARYLQTLVDNEHGKVGVPDATPRKTFCFTSTSSFPVPMTMNSGGTEANFAVGIVSQFGDTTDLTHYQVAVADVPTDTWDTTDWSNPANYLGAMNGRDPRVDINAPFLTNGDTSSTAQTFTVTTPGLAQLSGGLVANMIDGAATMVDDQSSGNWLFDTTSHTIIVPAGTWNISTVAQATTTAGGAGQYFIGSNYTGANYEVVDSAISDVTVIDSYTPSSTVAALTATVLASNIMVFAPNSFRYTPMIGDNGTAAPAAAGKFSAITGDIRITPAVAPGYFQPGHGGAIQLIRPVAQTVLCTYIGTALTDGGRICSAYCSKETMRDNFFNVEANGQGPFQNAANLANADGAWDGALRDGTYVWWSPFDPSDWEFNSVPDMNKAQWPGMIISGTFAPTGATVGGGSRLTNILRCRVLTTWECTTTSTAFDTLVTSGSQNEMDCAFKHLANEPHALPNGVHKDWIQNVLRGLIKYGPSVGTAAMKVAALLV